MTQSLIPTNPEELDALMLDLDRVIAEQELAIANGTATTPAVAIEEPKPEPKAAVQTVPGPFYWAHPESSSFGMVNTEDELNIYLGGDSNCVQIERDDYIKLLQEREREQHEANEANKAMQATTATVDDVEVAALLAEIETEATAKSSEAEATATKTSAAETPPWEEPAAPPAAPRRVQAAPAPAPISAPAEDIYATDLMSDVNHLLQHSHEVEYASSPKVYRANISTKGGLCHYIDVPQFQYDTHVDETNMDEAMMRQSGMRAFYSTQAAYAEAQAGRERAKFEILESKLYDVHRKALVARGDAKVTEGMINAAVKSDHRWLTGKNRVIEAETIAQINKGLVISMSDRRDMLIQLGADRREEYKGQLRIMEKTSEKATLAERGMAAAKHFQQ